MVWGGIAAAGDVPFPVPTSFTAEKRYRITGEPPDSRIPAKSADFVEIPPRRGAYLSSIGKSVTRPPAYRYIPLSQYLVVALLNRTTAGGGIR
jgi:hypothetical protein